MPGASPDGVVTLGVNETGNRTGGAELAVRSSKRSDSVRPFDSLRALRAFGFGRFSPSIHAGNSRLVCRPKRVRPAVHVTGSIY